MRTHSLTARAAILVLAVQAAAPIALPAAPRPVEEVRPRHTGPWDLEALRRPPAAEWGPENGPLREVRYEGEPFGGKPTRVFAWYARPSGPGPFPAMLLVHGGGGRAFAEWASLWASRGYAALAMDLAGSGPDGKRQPDGGPGQDDASKFRDFGAGEVREMWTYHAVAAVLRGHSLLAAQPAVDAARIGITGISWGGYLTCIVTGIDDRLKVSVPVYGCGFIHENSSWLDRFRSMSGESRARWVESFEPSRYLGAVRCPILFVNGTNDFAYPLDSYQRSYRLVPGEADRSIQVRLPHGHPEGWAPVEIGLFADTALRGGAPLPRIGEASVAGGRASAAVTAATRIEKAELHFTTDTGPWKDRLWISEPAKAGKDDVAADLPPRRPLVFFLTVTDERGATASSPPASLPGAAPAPAGASAAGAEDAWRQLEPHFKPPAGLALKRPYRSPLLFADGTPVRSAEEWPRRRQEILASWQALLGPWPPIIEKQEVEELEVKERDGLVERRVRFAITPRRPADGHRTEGYLLEPPGGGPRPAVLAVFYEPGTAIGKGKPRLDFAYQLARRGFVTLSMGLGASLYYPDEERPALQPLSALAYAAANAYHVLASHPRVDAGRVGIVGHSYGAKWAMFASSMYDRFACAAWSDGGIVFDESRPNVNYWEPWYLGHEAGKKRKPGVPRDDNPRTGAYRTLMERGQDLHELHALMAPRPFLVSGGSEDPPARWSALRHAVEVNRLLGHEDRVAMTNRAEHTPSAESNEVLYLFFEHFLLREGESEDRGGAGF
ncbi:MAG TPA: acetylxylan esterase [Planctomycetota bacterium]|nr:acetylxylan esterase [Planctomycetota bacterium]